MDPIGAGMHLDPDLNRSMGQWSWARSPSTVRLSPQVKPPGPTSSSTTSSSPLRPTASRGTAPCECRTRIFDRASPQTRVTAINGQNYDARFSMPTFWCWAHPSGWVTRPAMHNGFSSAWTRFSGRPTQEAAWCHSTGLPLWPSSVTKTARTTLRLTCSSAQRRGIHHSCQWHDLLGGRGDAEDQLQGLAVRERKDRSGYEDSGGQRLPSGAPFE